MNPKIKKRIKLKDIIDKFKDKVSQEQFRSVITGMQAKHELLHDRVEVRMPAMEYDLNNSINKKLDIEEFQNVMAK